MVELLIVMVMALLPQVQPPSEVPSFVEPEWAQAWLDHQANPPLLPHIHLPIQFGGGMGSDVEQWRELVSGYFPPEQVGMALCVIRGESGGNPTADNPTSTAAGLWQFIKSTWDAQALALGGPSYDSGAVYDPVIATEYAAYLWGQSGWGPWSAARRCR